MADLFSFLTPMLQQTADKAQAAVVESAKDLPMQVAGQVVGQVAKTAEQISTTITEGKEQLQKKVDEAVFTAEVYVTTQLALQFVSTAALVGMFILALKSRKAAK